ncbi:hypothetical protein CDL15_Pgr004161 [Punica granatum]|uniref:Uncharacterized protein n=1 Tax=Punica granatum TaxID=22663 RepID=A0A218XGY9_PUNGR|nr:hypothetical protein CDL15_Pgr004161 [Punica granatum]
MQGTLTRGRGHVFKVYIVRASESDEVAGAHCLDEPDPSLERAFPEIDTKASRTESSADDERRICNTDTCLLDLPKHDVEDISAEALDENRFQESVVNFRNVKGWEHSAAVVDGVDIDSELPKHVRAKYYELCCSQKSLLHEKLLMGLNSKLALGMVSETVNIADAIRASKITTSIQDFTTWGKTLKAFKDLGMDVGFLLARLDQLMNLAIKSKRIKEARRERAAAEQEMRILEAKVLEVEITINNLDAEISTLDKDENGFELDVMFHEVSCAPW